jgi:hypothetical protein
MCREKNKRKEGDLPGQKLMICSRMAGGPAPAGPLAAAAPEAIAASVDSSAAATTAAAEAHTLIAATLVEAATAAYPQQQHDRHWLF